MVTGTVVHVEVPTGLYSMFQAVSVPVETQLTVAETSPMLETETLDGLGQEGGVPLMVSVVMVPAVGLEVV